MVSQGDTVNVQGLGKCTVLHFTPSGNIKVRVERPPQGTTVIRPDQMMGQALQDWLKR
jgi:hypothetical protein